MPELSEDKLEEFLEVAAPYIGRIIIEFNSLEALLDYCIKELVSETEGRDDMIFVFLAEMSYSSKVTSLMNLYGQINHDCELNFADKLNSLEKQLREAARRRNQYAHGHWYDASEGKYLPVKITAKRDGVYHIYRKFEVSNMESDLEFIQMSQTLLDEFDEELNDTLHSKYQR